MSAIELLAKLVLFSVWLLALMLVAAAALGAPMIFGLKAAPILLVAIPAFLAIEIVGRKLFKLLVGEYD